MKYYSALKTWNHEIYKQMDGTKKAILSEVTHHMVCIPLYVDIGCYVDDNHAAIYRPTKVKCKIMDWG